MKIKEVIDYLDSVFHPEYQEDYDNSGYLLGRAESEFRGALIALDMTPAVVDEALEAGCFNLIVTHHPFIFRGLKRLTDDSETGHMIWKLIQNDIAVYAAHTNLDNMPWGVNGALSEQLGLQNCRILRGVQRSAGECEGVQDNTIGAGIIGELPEPMPVEDFLKKVKKVIGIPFIRVSPLSTLHSPLSTLHRVALCGGSGSEFIGDAMAAGADIYLTADLKYHDFQRTEGRMVLADIGHYESEQFAKRIIFDVISRKFCNFAVRFSERQQSIVQYI